MLSASAGALLLVDNLVLTTAPRLYTVMPFSILMLFASIDTFFLLMFFASIDILFLTDAHTVNPAKLIRV